MSLLNPVLPCSKLPLHTLLPKPLGLVAVEGLPHCPAQQAWGPSLAQEQKKPTGQGVPAALLDPPAQALPGGGLQASHATAPPGAPLKRPGGHCTQAEALGAPALGLKVPWGHSVRTPALQVLPGGHSRQCAASLLLPAGPMV
jgi:hypothetical protein